MSTEASKGSKAREPAVRILVALEKDPFAHAGELVREACERNGLAKRERRFVHELVTGVLRRRMTLDAILGAHSRTRPKDLERRVRQILRVGAYQLLYLDGVPAFAAISTTVSLVGRDARTRAFVNAILREIDRRCRRIEPERDRGGASPTKRLVIHDRKICFFSKPVFPDPAEDPVVELAVRYSHPRFLVERWVGRLGAEAAAELLAIDNEHAPLSVRVHLGRGDRDDCLRRLHEEGIRCEEGTRDESIRVHSPAIELVRTRTFRAGRCTVQDETAMGVAPLLAPAPDERILDLCAAPGGKTGQLAELAPLARIVGVDRDTGRVELLRETLARLGHESVQTVCFDALSAPAELPEELAGCFDAVLLDAPCSNSGVLRRRPEARYRFDEARLRSLTQTQDALLDSAAARLAAAGRIVYSTCSVEEDENEARVQAFVVRHPEFRVAEQWSRLPRSGGGDGGFACRLERSSEPGE